jgi:hypothetical protein
MYKRGVQTSEQEKEEMCVIKHEVVVRKVESVVRRIRMWWWRAGQFNLAV